MDNRSLQKKLADIQAELTNLKTAHLHGLGGFQFFTGSGSIVSTQAIESLEGVIHFTDVALFPPLVQAYVEENGVPIEYGWQIVVNNDNTISVKFTALAASTTYTVRAVSTAQISNIVMRQG